MGEREDLVQVKLSARGEELSCGCLVLAGGKYHFTFMPGEAQQVTRAEWTQILSRETFSGEPLFEVCDPVASASGGEE